MTILEYISQMELGVLDGWTDERPSGMDGREYGQLRLERMRHREG